MRVIGVPPALALLAGAVCGALSGVTSAPFAWGAAFLAASAWAAWFLDRLRLTLAALLAGFFVTGLALASDARSAALRTTLRDALDSEFGGFLIDTAAVGGPHDPVPTRLILAEDAAVGDETTTMRGDAEGVWLNGRWEEVRGGMTVSVGGFAARERAGEWRAGRAVEMPVTFRRPTRYLNDGVPDFERDLALDGTTLFGSVKSALLVDVLSRGSALDETAARVRIHVRRSVRRWVAPHDEVSAAIVTAVLIGDRTGLPDSVRMRLQAAGTYHVIAISGGNIAILAGLTLLVLLVAGLTGRPAALITIVILIAYAQLVTAGASVWRATLMATLYLAARLLDHRTPPWHAMAVAAALVVCVRPLDVRDVGFILTFGATAALLEGGRRAARLAPRRPAAAWVLASVAASLAAEIALLPVSAWTFSRVTSAGLVLNLAAVPLMGVVQVGGMAAAALDALTPLASLAGWLAHLAARSLVASAGLVDVVPWLTARVPPPALAIVVAYYGGLLAALAGAGLMRIAGIATVTTCAVAIVSGAGARPLSPASAGDTLRLTVFDVGQGDAALLQFPGGASLLVDTGGIPFGGGFDIGGRVLAPALWARGVRSLGALLLTHGDPDHIGGAAAVIADFEPDRVWEGVPVPRHVGLQQLQALARARSVTVEQRTAGEVVAFGGARIRVLHPPPPDWERQRVRNDDSVVLEVLHGGVAILLAGDVGASVERQLVPQLTPAPIRILKVAHHGSRTSTSRELLDGWRPHIAVVSAGRGNTFGHPAPEAIERLESVGAAIYRTDLHGQITIESDGGKVVVRTFTATKSTKH